MALRVGMIAGGTGITPMLVRYAELSLLAELILRPFVQQIIRAIVKNPLDLTKVSLIYANVNPTDILLKAELDQLAKDHPTRFSVYYVLNNPPENWDGGVGFVSQEMIKEKLPPAAADMKMLLCGQSRPSPIL